MGGSGHQPVPPPPGSMQHGGVNAELVMAGHRPDNAERAVSTDFAALLSAHWDRAYRFAYHLTGTVDEAEDLMQQAAEEALVAFGQFQPGTRFDRWFMRILYTSLLDLVRRRRRRQFFSLEEVPQAALTANPDAEPEAVLGLSLDGPVRRALESLPPEYRAAVILVDIQELPYEEAAAILHCPVGTVRSRLHRGRLALREWLRPYVDAMKRGEL